MCYDAHDGRWVKVAVSFADARSVEFEVDFVGGAGPVDIEITLIGVPTEQGLRLLHERLVSDPHFRHGLTSIVDMAALDTSGLSDGEIEQITKPIVARDWDYPPAAVAIIAPDSQSHNFVRSYRAYLGGSRSNRHLFTSRADAVAWIKTFDAPHSAALVGD